MITKNRLVAYIIRSLKQWRILLILSCFLGLIAPTLLITAFAFLDPSISIVQVSLVEQYNQAVVGWREIYRDEFNQFKYFVNITYNNNNNTLQPTSSSLVMDFSSSRVTEQIKTTDTILKYIPLSFNCNISLIIPPIIIQNMTQKPPFLNVKVYSYTEKKLLLETNADLYQYNDNNLSRKLNGLCLVVNNETSLDSQSCYYGQNNYYLNYTTQFIPTIGDTLNYSNVFIRIKYYKDPYLVASDISHGTFAFAMSKDLQEALGTFFLILGGVFTVLFVLIILMMVKKKGLAKLFDGNGGGTKNSMDENSHDSGNGMDGIPMSNLDMMRVHNYLDQQSSSNNNISSSSNSNNGISRERNSITHDIINEVG